MTGAPLRPGGLSARVALVPVVVGDDGATAGPGAPEHDGVVVEAFGSGNMPPGAVPAIRRWLDDGQAGRAGDPLPLRAR